MIKVSGFLRKLTIRPERPCSYHLCLDKQAPVALNPHLGKSIHFSFKGLIRCINCQRPTKKSFNQGFCFVCFRKLAQCDQCMVKPELCHYHLGTCREPKWGQSVCMKKHIVYMTYTSDIKVGITRHSNVTSRWLDQGATLALPLFEVATRRQSGLIEVLLKHHFKDRTNWRTMLKNDHYDTNLLVAWRSFLDVHGDSLQSHISQSEVLNSPPPKSIDQHQPSQSFYYPRLDTPINVKSINAEKSPDFSGTLIGMKGQYLLLDTGVINIRKYTGYDVQITFSP